MLEHLKKSIQPNPLKGEHVLLAFKKEKFLNHVEAKFKISYIPDREIAEEQHFSHFLTVIEKENYSKLPEQVLSDILKHFYHEVLPYYVKIEVKIHHKNGVVQHLNVVKKQPDYKIPEELEDLL